MTSRDQVLPATVMRALPNKRYCVRLADGRDLQAVLSPGCNEPQLEPGQAVSIELSPYDPSMCRIISGDDGKAVVVREYR